MDGDLETRIGRLESTVALLLEAVEAMDELWNKSVVTRPDRVSAHEKVEHARRSMSN